MAVGGEGADLIAGKVADGVDRQAAVGNAGRRAGVNGDEAAVGSGGEEEIADLEQVARRRRGAGHGVGERVGLTRTGGEEELGRCAGRVGRALRVDEVLGRQGEPEAVAGGQGRERLEDEAAVAAREGVRERDVAGLGGDRAALDGSEVGEGRERAGHRVRDVRAQRPVELELEGLEVRRVEVAGGDHQQHVAARRDPSVPERRRTA